MIFILIFPYHLNSMYFSIIHTFFTTLSQLILNIVLFTNGVYNTNSHKMKNEEKWHDCHGHPMLFFNCKINLIIVYFSQFSINWSIPHWSLLSTKYICFLLYCKFMSFRSESWLKNNIYLTFLGLYCSHKENVLASY